MCKEIKQCEIIRCIGQCLWPSLADLYNLDTGWLALWPSHPYRTGDCWTSCLMWTCIQFSQFSQFLRGHGEETRIHNKDHSTISAFRTSHWTEKTTQIDQPSFCKTNSCLAQETSRTVPSCIWIWHCNLAEYEYLNIFTLSPSITAWLTRTGPTSPPHPYAVSAPLTSPSVEWCKNCHIIHVPGWAAL